MGKEDNQGIAMKYLGDFKDLKDILANAPRVVGNTASCCNAFFCYDGQKWVVLKCSAICRFKVLDRGHIAGRGYYTVIDNSDGIPLMTSHKILYQDREVDIKSIEYLMKAMDPPYPDDKWSLFTNEEIKGDEVLVQLYEEPYKDISF